MTQFTLGFIGLGTMGAPICRNLAAKAGVPVMANDADPNVMRNLAGENITPARRLSTLAQTADIVFLCLPSASEVRDVASELIMHTRPGWIVVDLSTTSIELTHRLAENFAEQKSAFVDAPVSPGPAAAEAGTLSVMVGSQKPVFDSLKPVFEHFAKDVTHCGPSGSGQMVKILNNMVMFENLVATGEALAVGRRLGLDGDMLLRTIAKGSGSSYALRGPGLKSMVPGNYPQGQFPLNYARKDLELAIELAKQTDIDVQGALNVQRLMDEAAGKGFGDVFYPVIQQLIEPRRK